MLSLLEDKQGKMMRSREFRLCLDRSTTTHTRTVQYKPVRSSWVPSTSPLPDISSLLVCLQIRHGDNGINIHACTLQTCNLRSCMHHAQYTQPLSRQASKSRQMWHFGRESPDCVHACILNPRWSMHATWLEWSLLGRRRMGMINFFPLSLGGWGMLYDILFVVVVAVAVENDPLGRGWAEANATNMRSARCVSLNYQTRAT